MNQNNNNMNKNEPFPTTEYPTTIKHQWNEEHDRWMYIEYNEQQKIIGLNYMQGDDYKFFKDNFTESDEGLTEFYNEMKQIFPVELASVTCLEFINKVMWSYSSALTSNAIYSKNK